jgi:hypothetical protein
VRRTLLLLLLLMFHPVLVMTVGMKMMVMPAVVVRSCMGQLCWQ